MEKKFIRVLDFICRAGLDNSLWSVEKYELPESYYSGDSTDSRILQPHLAIWDFDCEMYEWSEVIGSADDLVFGECGENIYIWFFDSEA